MFRLNPKELRKQLKRLGLRDANVDYIEAEEVVIRTPSGEEVVVPAPQVIMIEAKGSVMLQVIGQEVERRKPAEQEAAQAESGPSEEDVEFVAQQTGVSLDEARQALREADGDIAAAIMLIEERKRASGGSS